MVADGGMAEGATKRRSRAKSRARQAGAEPPVAHIRALVAALQSAQPAPAPLPAPSPEPPPAPDLAGQEDLVGLLKQFLAAREQERAEWEAERTRLAAAIAEAERIARLALVEREEASDQHRHAMADLALEHEHQRSVWLLERRRLEITLRALEAGVASRLGRRLRLRPALAAGLALLAVAGSGLSRDSSVAALDGTALDDLGPVPFALASPLAERG